MPCSVEFEHKKSFIISGSDLNFFDYHVRLDTFGMGIEKNTANKCCKLLWNT